MSEYKHVETTVDVPMDAGIEGFLVAIRAILQLSRVTELRVHGKGKVTYKRWEREEDDANANLRMDFESVTPIAVVRNNEIIDAGVADEHESPAVVLVKMLQRVMVDHLYPTAFMIGSNSSFFDWFRVCGVDIQKNADRIFGIQLLRDRFIEDDTLLLGASYGPGGSLIDTRLTYKMMMPAREAPVRILPGVEDEAVGSDDSGWADRRVEAVGAPALGHAGTRPSGTVSGLPEVGVPRGGGPGNRPRSG